MALVGSGWRTVAYYRSSVASGKQLGRLATALLGGAAHQVKGKWGSGRLLVTPILTVLVTSTGLVLAGPVIPAVLYRLAA